MNDKRKKCGDQNGDIIVWKRKTTVAKQMRPMCHKINRGAPHLESYSKRCAKRCQPLTFWLSVCLSAYLSVCLSVCLYLSLSVCRRFMPLSDEAYWDDAEQPLPTLLIVDVSLFISKYSLVHLPRSPFNKKCSVHVFINFEIFGSSFLRVNPTCLSVWRSFLVKQKQLNSLLQQSLPTLNFPIWIQQKCNSGL